MSPKMSSGLAKLVLGLGDQLMGRVSSSLKGSWDKFKDSDRLAIREVLDDSADLIFRGLAGEDVKRESAMVKSTIADWAWIGADKARAAVLAALKDAGAFAVQLIAQLL